jgi:hypothetical protein
VYPSNEGEIEINKFYHIVYTITEKGVVNVYYNGKIGLGATINKPTIFDKGLNNLKLLLGGGMSSKAFVGGVDNIRLFNKVLSESEVQSLFEDDFVENSH